MPGASYIGQSPEMALSPDGEILVFEGEAGLHARSLSEFGSQLIPGTQGAGNPFFSPDGRFLGFTQVGIIMQWQGTDWRGIPEVERMTVQM